MPRFNWILPLTLIVLLAACTGESPVISTLTLPTAAVTPALQTPTLAPTTAPTEEPAAPSFTEPPAPSLSFEPATYRDEEAGFEFQYPAAWTVSNLGSLGTRGSGAQLLLNGKPQMNLTLYQWDPKGDLAAWAAHRKGAWSASGFEILSEEYLALASGEPAVRFVVQTPEQQALFFFTPIGDRYLELSGAGDLSLLKEITRTLRLL